MMSTENNDFEPATLMVPSDHASDIDEFDGFVDLAQEFSGESSDSLCDPVNPESLLGYGNIRYRYPPRKSDMYQVDDMDVEKPVAPTPTQILDSSIPKDLVFEVERLLKLSSSAETQFIVPDMSDTISFEKACNLEQDDTSSTFSEEEYLIEEVEQTLVEETIEPGNVVSEIETQEVPECNDDENPPSPRTSSKCLMFVLLTLATISLMTATVVLAPGLHSLISLSWNKGRNTVSSNYIPQSSEMYWTKLHSPPVPTVHLPENETDEYFENPELELDEQNSEHQQGNTPGTLMKLKDKWMRIFNKMRRAKKTAIANTFKSRAKCAMLKRRISNEGVEGRRKMETAVLQSIENVNKAIGAIAENLHGRLVSGFENIESFSRRTLSNVKTLPAAITRTYKVVKEKRQEKVNETMNILKKLWSKIRDSRLAKNILQLVGKMSFY